VGTSDKQQAMDIVSRIVSSTSSILMFPISSLMSFLRISSTSTSSSPPPEDADDELSNNDDECKSNKRSRNQDCDECESPLSMMASTTVASSMATGPSPTPPKVTLTKSCSSKKRKVAFAPTSSAPSFKSLENVKYYDENGNEESAMARFYKMLAKEPVQSTKWE
jgi:hypothetical protein